MDEVVPVLRDVARYRGRRLLPQLHPETVGELPAIPALVIRSQSGGEVLRFGSPTCDLGECRDESVASEIARHVTSCLVVWQALEIAILQPRSDHVVCNRGSMRSLSAQHLVDREYLVAICVEPVSHFTHFGLVFECIGSFRKGCRHLRLPAVAIVATAA